MCVQSFCRFDQSYLHHMDQLTFLVSKQVRFCYTSIQTVKLKLAVKK